jgi:hypothetical protein
LHNLPNIFKLAKDCFGHHVTLLPVVIHSEKMQNFDLNNIPFNIIIKYLREAKETAGRLNISSNIEDLIKNYFNLSNSEIKSDIHCCDDRTIGGEVGISDSYCLKPWYHIVIYSMEI